MKAFQKTAILFALSSRFSLATHAKVGNPIQSHLSSLPFTILQGCNLLHNQLF